MFFFFDSTSDEPGPPSALQGWIPHFVRRICPRLWILSEERLHPQPTAPLLHILQRIGAACRQRGDEELSAVASGRACVASEASRSRAGLTGSRSGRASQEGRDGEQHQCMCGGGGCVDGHSWLRSVGLLGDGQGDSAGVQGQFCGPEWAVAVVEYFELQLLHVVRGFMPRDGRRRAAAHHRRQLGAQHAAVSEHEQRGVGDCRADGTRGAAKTHDPVGALQRSDPDGVGGRILRVDMAPNQQRQPPRRHTLQLGQHPDAAASGPQVQPPDGLHPVLLLLRAQAYLHRRLL